MAILSLQNISKEYTSDGQSVRALDGVTLDVAEGEFVALVGRSGCGKSTLLHLAGAMDFPTSGTVRIESQPTSDLNDAQQTQLRRVKVGFVFQSFQLLHTLTVLENVELPLLLAGKAGSRALALAHAPRILLADEPTGNLDTTTGSVILELLLRLTREQKTATIMATHSPEAASVCDTLVKLRDGRVEEVTRRRHASMETLL